MGNSGMALYNLRRGLFDTGDILEWRSNSIIGAGIRAVTGKDVNHSGMVLISPFVGCGPSQRVWSIEALGFGLYPNLVSNQLRDYTGEVYLLKLKKEFFDYRQSLAVNMMSMTGTKYDYLSIFRQMFGKVSSGVGRLFCSEAIDVALRKTGMIGADFNHGKRLRPGEFGETKIYEEPIRCY